MTAGNGHPGGERGPGEALRALTDAQRRSVAAASDLFDALMGEIGAREPPRLRVGAALRALGEAADGNDAARMRAVVARAIDLYADFVRETFELYADMAQPAVDGRGAAVSASGGGAAVELDGAPGQAAAAPVWLHNATESPMIAVALRLTDLAAHDGATVAGAHGTFSPASLDVAAGGSGSATLQIAVPQGAPAGAYHGLVLASGLPAASVPVLLVVR